MRGARFLDDARRHRFTSALVVAALLGRCGWNLFFALTVQPHEIAFSRTMWLDGQSYLWGAGRLLAHGFSFSSLDDICHSPGEQVLVALVFRLTHSSIPAFRGLLVLFDLLASALVIPLAWRLTRDFQIACAAGALTIFSNELGAYCATLQYEPCVAFLIVLLFWLVLDAALWRRVFLAGAVAALLCIFRAHFVLLGAATVAAFLLLARRGAPGYLRAAAIFCLGFSALAALWIIPLSLSRHQLIFFHVACRVSAYTHMNDIGFTWPYRDVIAPSGLQMVLQEPRRYLWLVGQRLAILWGFIPDTWAQPVPFQETAEAIGFSAYRSLFAWAYLLSAVLGAALALWKYRRSPETEARLALLLTPVFASLGLALLMSSATRYLLPGLPLLAIFQSYFLIDLFRALRRIEWRKLFRRRNSARG